jgi:hypothetical protein
VSYLPSPITRHDDAAGVMAAFGSVAEHLGRVRALPAQTMTLNSRLAGFISTNCRSNCSTAIR